MSHAMNVPCRIVVALILATSLRMSLVTDAVLAAEKPIQGRALLVGCTKYDHLEPSLHLQGPANDVALMRSLLIERFAFPAERIVSLTELTGRADVRPTRANIEREFQRLGREALPGEPIVIFLAGHGSQQPDQDPSPDDPEPDGRDELFLPADIQGWDGRAGRVPNAIVDDELRAWLSAIEKRGSAVTVIVDACCSGTMTRGVGERVRQIPPGLLVPLDELSKADARAIRTRSSAGTDATRGGEATRGGRPTEMMLDTPSVVAIYASQSSETTVEKLLPADGKDRKPHGLLTYTISQILSRSTEPMTCRELVQQVQTQYAGWGRSSPTPMIEGRDRDRELFGLTVWPDRSRIILSKTPRGWTINAGILHGVTQNSLLAIFPVGTSRTNEAVGHVRVQVARTVDADVVPCLTDGQPATTALPDSGRCELVFVDAGDLRLRTAITHEATADPAWLRRCQVALQPEALFKQHVRLVRLVESASEADWLVRIGERDVWLIPAVSGVPGEGDVSHSPLNSIGPKPLSDSMVEWLGPALERIARAANLKQLAAQEETTSRQGNAVRIELQIEHALSSQPADTPRHPTLRDGEKLTIRVKNPCSFPVDVTLLVIDRQSGIDALFPQQGEINRLQPGDSFPVSTRVVAESRGLEHLVAIAVKAERDVIDFSCLAQPNLNALKTRGTTATSLASPLGQLLDHAVFAGSPTRGLKKPAIKAHSLQLLTWEIQP